MDNLNFTLTPAPAGNQDKSVYDVAAALMFFKSAGSEEQVAAGKVIFAEQEKRSRLFLQRDKMYLLTEGEVALTVNKKYVGSIGPGEIFGELASITHTARSATATAKTACRLWVLDDKQFYAALREHPEFALSLMVLIVSRLRKTIGKLNASGTLASGEEWNESAVFDRKLLDELVEELGNTARMRYKADKVIMQEGQAGVLMYVVLEGWASITIQGSVVEKIGPGGVFGEMALIEQNERLASAVAETDCTLLAINRKVFIELVKDNPAFGTALLGAVSERARFIAARYAQ